MTARILTVGHSNHSITRFFELLQLHDVKCLVDVRAVPHSRHNPQFNQNALSHYLTENDIDYHHFAALGGRRFAAAGNSPNNLWDNPAFRNYADYAVTAAFKVALDDLQALAQAKLCAVMCAEADWHNCHRRIIADYLLQRGCDVQHIIGNGAVEAARLTAGAVVNPDNSLLYAAPPPAQYSLF